VVTDKGFSEGSTFIDNRELADVGDIKKIHFRNGGYDNYQCHKVII